MIRFVHLLIWWGVLSGLFFPAKGWSQNGPKPVGVARVQALETSKTLELPGTVVPWKETTLAAEIEGRVEAIPVREGQFVRKGTPLVQFRTVPLKLELDLALAEKKRVATLLEELRTGTRQEVIEAARYARNQAQARFELAEKEFKRIETLYREGVVSLDTFDKSRTQAEAARAELQEKEEVLKELVAGPRIERIRQEEANLEAAEARVQIIQDNIERTTLRAPFNGYIVKKESEVGEWLEPGDPAITLVAAYPVKVEVNLPQFYFHAVKSGTRAKVILDPYDPTRPPREFKGWVVEKVTSGDLSSRTFPVRIRVNTSGRKIAPGMLVRVELELSKKEPRRLFVPKDAIVRTPADTAVWVIRTGPDKQTRVEKVPVIPGEAQDSLVAVQAPDKKIRAGDWVVVQGNERLKPDAPVTIVKRF